MDAEAQTEEAASTDIEVEIIEEIPELLALAEEMASEEGDGGYVDEVLAKEALKKRGYRARSFRPRGCGGANERAAESRVQGIWREGQAEAAVDAPGYAPGYAETIALVDSRLEGVDIRERVALRTAFERLAKGETLYREDAEGILGNEDARVLYEEMVGPIAEGARPRDLVVQAAARGEMQNSTQTNTQAQDFNFADAPSSGIKFDDMSTYTPKKQQTIKQYRLTVDPEIRKAAEDFRNTNTRQYLRLDAGPVSARTVNRVYELLGIDVDGFTHIVNESAIEHIEDRHGQKGKQDHSMINTNDVGRLPYILENYDTVDILKDKKGNPVFSSAFKDRYNNPAPMVIYKKKINGTYYLVEAVVDSKKQTLWIVSAYINDN